MFDLTTETATRPAFFGDATSLRSFTLKARANTFSGSAVDLPTISKQHTTQSFGKARPKSSIQNILTFRSRRGTVSERHSVTVDEGGKWRHSFFFGGKASLEFQSPPPSKQRPSTSGAGKNTFLKRLSTVLRKSSVPLSDDTSGPFSRRDSVIRPLEDQSSNTIPGPSQTDRQTSAVSFATDQVEQEQTETQARERFLNFRFGGLERTRPASPEPAETLPPTSLPSPCEGLFEESSSPHSLPSYDTNLEHVFPVPLPLSPLLTPVIGSSILMIASTRSSSPTELTDDVLQPCCSEDDCHSPGLTRSPSETSDESSSCAAPTSLESALCMTGCTLKSSTLPKTWAGDASSVRRMSVALESPTEKGFWEHPLSVPSSMVTRGSSESDDEGESTSSVEDFVLTKRPTVIRHSRANSEQLALIYSPSVRRTTGPRRALSLTIHDPRRPTRRR